MLCLINVRRSEERNRPPGQAGAVYFVLVSLRMRLIILGLLSSMLIYISCEGNESGRTIIHNNSRDTLLLTMVTKEGHSDVLIAPGSMNNILSFSSLKAKMSSKCCPCRFNSLLLQPLNISKKLLKSINDENNWAVVQSRTGIFGTSKVRCEFVIDQSDIQ